MKMGKETSAVKKALEQVFHSMGVVMHISRWRLVENSWITG